MTSEWLWLLDHDLLTHLQGNQLVSTTYILPGAHAPNNPELLAGRSLWVALHKKGQNRLYKKLHVSLIEQFEDGVNADDYILTVKQSSSFVLSRDPGSKLTLGRAFEQYDRSGIYLLGDIEVGQLDNVVANNLARNLQDPPKHMLSFDCEIPRTPNLVELAASLLEDITTRFSFEEIWGQGLGSELPPFANFALTLAQRLGIDTNRESLARELSRNDPCNASRTWQDHIRAEVTPRYSVPSVDARFDLIDPSKVYARRFLASADSQPNMMDSLNKTNRAEKRHQDMLREISMRFFELSMEPKQSSSIDLYVGDRESSTIFEIKSSTEESFLSQVSKGVFQLNVYADGLEKQGFNIKRRVLIVESIDQDELHNYAARIGLRMGVAIYYYYMTDNWPERVRHNKQSLESGFCA